jgi:ADP-ribose pyrophosphatase
VPEGEFRISGARTVADYGFLSVEELDVTGPAGVFTRIAVRHPGAVAVVALADKGVVLIRQFRAPIDQAVLEIPAGKLDVDGESTTLAVARELEEEAGYRPGRVEHVADFFTAPGFTDERLSLFLATDLESVTSAPHGPEEESAEVVCVAVDEIPALLASGAVQDAKTIIGLQWLLLRDL